MLGSDLLRTEGKFKSKCGCINHDIFSNSVEHIILRKASLVAHRLSYKSLFEKNLINKRAKNVCSACLAVSKDCSSSNTVCITNSSLENIPEEDETIPEDNTDLSGDNYVEIIKNIENISNFLQGKDWVSLPTEICNKLTSLAGTIHQTINRQTFEDSQQASGGYKNVAYLINIGAHYWLSKRNSILISFLENRTGVSINDKRTKRLNAFSHLIEQVLYTRNLNIITPFSLKEIWLCMV